MTPERRSEIAKALTEVLQSAFPGNELLPLVVRDWIGDASSDPPTCAVCARSIATRFAVQPAGTRFRLLVGKDARSPAVCSPCLDAARDAFEPLPEGRPSWDMVLAQLERALALLPEDDAAVARACLGKHPDSPAVGRCALCAKNAPTVRGQAGGICQPCAQEGRSVMQDLAARSEVESDSRCPECDSTSVAAGAVGIEFTEMTCLSCGNSQICDVWELSDWHG